MADTETLEQDIIESADEQIIDIPDIGPRVKQLQCAFSKDDAVDADKKGFIATITTDTIDRDREVILPKGVNFERYTKNPVVFFGHESWKMPIAKTLWIKSRGGSILAKAVPAPTQEAQDAFKLISEGFLQAVSVGFDPSPYGDLNGPPTEKEIAKRPDLANVKWMWRKVDLLEWSVVGIPANPDAIIEAVEKGLHLSDDMKQKLRIPIITIKQVKTAVEQLAEDLIEVQAKERPDPIPVLKRAIVVRQWPRMARLGPSTAQMVVRERIPKLTGLWL